MSSDAVGNYLNLLFCIMLTVALLAGIFMIGLMCWTSIRNEGRKW